MQQKKSSSRSNYQGRTVEFTPKNNSQRLHYTYLQDKDYSVVFAKGPSGVGKTFTSLAYAAQQYKENNKEIIITRSLVGVDAEEVGFLKGDLDDKLQPWMSVLLEPLYDLLGKSTVEQGLKTERVGRRIRIEPITFMRGKTFEDCVLICTECQNLTWMQLKTLLTRQGGYSKFIIEGDPNQSDLNLGVDNGFKVALDLIEKQGLPVPTVGYTSSDCVRSGTVKMWLDAMEKENL